MKTEENPLIFKDSWIYEHQESILCLEFGDINGNGRIEIIAATNKGRILIISSDGTLLRDTVVCNNSAIFHMLAINLNENGKIKLIVGGIDGLLRAFMVANSYELEPDWVHQFGGSISGILFNDVNSDGVKEIIGYSLDKTIRVLNPSDGSLVWGQVFEEGVSEAIVLKKKPTESGLQVLACGNDGTLRCFSGIKGEMLWFKHFSDKLRCISILSTSADVIIACGGDDKRLHFLRESDREDIGHVEFEDYAWKCFSLGKDKIVASSYSFAFFNDNAVLERLDFSSKICCVDNNLHVLWEINGFNVEALELVVLKTRTSIVAGTTKGEIVMIDPINGNYEKLLKAGSCVNDIMHVPKLGMMLSCHDDGQVKAWYLSDVSN
ncbi:MAG: WD40 repeat domain-containing protein [Candidatus Lokiarchaeota archaeon]|nr:WD40 repeat domain-containing protein [Candidatus Lokiarchaeota archaeon]